MSEYNYNYIVSRSETEALKEIIFKRARERAEALNKETQDQYTSSIQKDLMEIARDSFSATSKNPFAPTGEPAVQEQKNTEDNDNIGFKHRENIKREINNKSKIIKNNMAESEVTANMLQARNEFTNRKGFMGALNFLNAQASLSLVNSKTKGFDAVA